MSDDYVRLAAPVYPEMQYCYSPGHESHLSDSKLTTSPRTTKRTYRHRKTQQKQQFPSIAVPPNVRPKRRESSTTESEEEELMDLEHKEKAEEEVVIVEKGEVMLNTTHLNPTEETLLNPSVDSAIDPSPRSSIDEEEASIFPFPTSSSNTNDTKERQELPPPLTASIANEHPLDYTKKSTRPIQQKSALSAMIAEKATAAENPFAEYSYVSGKGESKPITLCVYLPHSHQPYEPVRLIVRPDALIDDVIGYILYDYVEHKRGPELDVESLDLAEWVLLIAEDDGEIEEDLPAVDRARRIDWVSFDQFALCRATPSQVKQNDITRAKMGKSKPDIEALRKKKEASEPALPDLTIPQQPQPTEQHEDAVTGHLLHHQQPQEPDPSTVAVPVPSTKATLTKATMPMTPLKYFRLKLMTNEEVSATTAIPVYAEMFIGDVLELVSRKRKLDPNEYMLTIADTNVIVPNDTTVESMKEITDLTLVKKERTLTIPSSNHIWRSPMKRKKEEVNHPMYFSSTDKNQRPTTTNTNDGLLSQYKKYSVSRKMPMFVSKKMYILAIDGDYIHLMPPEHKGMFDSVKTTSFHASAIRSCKQSKKVPTNLKVIVLKERDYKTYDLEAESSKEAYEICARIRFLMQTDTHFDVIPTPTYNVETIPFYYYSFKLWDFAEMSASLNHIKDTRLIIYFLDSVELKKETVSNKCRENMIWLLKNYSEQLQNTMMITIANKQQELDAVDIQDIASAWTKDRLLMDLLKGHDWRLFSCNAVSGDGIDSIFHYITSKLNQRRDSTCVTNLSIFDPVKPWEDLPNAFHLNDQEFKDWFYRGKRFASFDYWCLIRIIYLTLIDSNNKKKMVILYDYLQAYCSEEEGTVDQIKYSETQTLFWIQMVSFGLLQLPLIEDSFDKFLERTQLKADCWKEHYSQRLFFSDRAAKEFLPPDKKPLPNAFKPSSLALKGSGLRIDYQIL
ncbi:hypothetical protein G6F57_005641 [Rhizopus arrhizus]|uniref:Sin1 middle CRIM domain-containing protein n=1 Tax=Rhizopus oryzae TaxID=64495 RepID=A0A9P6XCJ7_RHIOR|nr:hypothetical protein G6F23_001942 [Rhizopus arrhizus]KAG1416076.1 hypothetical protein G6F58_006159 [Rhizopus delemar]KAG0764385.1 hypothetical protein G6F24_005264 [Rhizopus arrhizus]KAG0790951.1 hypothetical protein G6F21_005433 [Rhizopus arrhizus]KAG0813601.1 hypothetical protein G6F20_005439 [Rhizopus arrhizus]